jgi:hypothetical protein
MVEWCVSRTKECKVNYLGIMMSDQSFRLLEDDCKIHGTESEPALDVGGRWQAQ